MHVLRRAAGSTTFQHQAARPVGLQTPLTALPEASEAGHGVVYPAIPLHAAADKLLAKFLVADAHTHGQEAV